MKKNIYLVDIENPKKFMFAILVGTKLTKIADESEIGKLFLKFAERQNRIEDK